MSLESTGVYYNEKISVKFPLDNRMDNLRNELLDGQNHEVFIEKFKTFLAGNLRFYIVNGIDLTKNCETGIVLLLDNATLKNVPLEDYSELKQFEMKANIVDNYKMHRLITRYGCNIQSLPMTSIEKIIASPPEIKKICVYTDPDGRKFISTRDAKSLGYDNPRDVSVLPNAIGESGYKLITEEEYEKLKRKYIISDEHVDKLNVIYYNGNYYVDWQAAYYGFEFPGLDYYISSNRCLIKVQFAWAKMYYSINLLTEKDLNINYEALHSESTDEENTTIPLVDATAIEEYENERQRIMKARFSEEDKQRMLKELEEEYRNNSGRSIR